MTTKQQRRLDLAESVCRLVMRHQSAGLIESQGYIPDVVSALHFMQDRAEKEGALKPGSLHWLGGLADGIRGALFLWMEAVGIDPRSYEKEASQRMAMEIAQEALGPEYEGEVAQTTKSKDCEPWVEHTANERASALIQEFSSGRIRSHEELRIAIAADILEAEHVARRPFLAYANVIFQACEDGMAESDQDRVTKATTRLLAEASRWMEIHAAGTMT